MFEPCLWCAFGHIFSQNIVSAEWFDPLMFTGNYLSHKPEDHSLFATHSQEFTPGAFGLLVVPKFHQGDLTWFQRPRAWYLEFKWRATTKSRTKKQRGRKNTLEWISVWVGGLKGIFSAKRFETHWRLVDRFWWALCFWSPDTSCTWQFQMNYTAVGWQVEIQVLFGNLGCQRHVPRPHFSNYARPIYCMTYRMAPCSNLAHGL